MLIVLDLSLDINQMLETIQVIWQCPKCNERAYATYRAIAEVGFPQCVDCKCDMAILE
jgi:hypothetical protein